MLDMTVAFGCDGMKNERSSCNLLWPIPLPNVFVRLRKVCTHAAVDIYKNTHGAAGHTGAIVITQIFVQHKYFRESGIAADVSKRCTPRFRRTSFNIYTAVVIVVCVSLLLYI